MTAIQNDESAMIPGRDDQCLRRRMNPGARIHAKSNAPAKRKDGEPSPRRARLQKSAGRHDARGGRSTPGPHRTGRSMESARRAALASVSSGGGDGMTRQIQPSPRTAGNGAGAGADGAAGFPEQNAPVHGRSGSRSGIGALGIADMIVPSSGRATSGPVTSSGASAYERAAQPARAGVAMQTARITAPIATAIEAVRQA